ncbi:DgyrCDS7688 [Dimorphilus gyrociliatus]|uniref:DgyrCDS7688 n=1 Tax=Dimorphilus gyrociliatus TaxID=2664684 RepID=A0A7I8VRW5_9ANNE|nr:DgyrCDS7688 [Dimorphilus gyrociliatus]
MSSESILLEEHERLDALIDLIPRASRYMLYATNVVLTCISANSKYIAIGSNNGCVFIYNRDKRTIEKLCCKDPTDVVSCITIKESVETLVFAGTRTGILYIFQLSAVLENGHIIKGSQWVVQGMHQRPVSTVCISENNQHLFSGDEEGTVVCTDMLFSLNETESAIITREGEEIVQLDYHKPLKVLLVSTKRRSILIDTDKGDQLIQIGSKERKIFLDFGACFFSSVEDPKNPKIFSSRPGMRIWKANITGKVEQTILFKDAIKEAKFPKIPLILNSQQQVKDEHETIQFGKVLKFQENFLITWFNSHLFVMTIGGTIVNSLENIPIRDVCVYDSEIFIILKFSKIDIIRVAVKPDDRFSIISKEKSQEIEQFEQAVHKIKDVSSKVWKNISKFGDKMAFTVPEGKRYNEDKSPSDPPSESNSAYDMLSDMQLREKTEEETSENADQVDKKLTDPITTDLKAESVTAKEDTPDLDLIGKKSFDDSIVFSIKTVKVKKKKKKAKKKVDEDSHSFVSSTSGSGSNEASISDTISLSSHNDKDSNYVNSIPNDLTDNKTNDSDSELKAKEFVKDQPKEIEVRDESNSQTKTECNEKEEVTENKDTDAQEDDTQTTDIDVQEKAVVQNTNIDDVEIVTEAKNEEATQAAEECSIKSNSEQLVEKKELQPESKSLEVEESAYDDETRDFSLPCEIFNGDNTSNRPSLSSSASLSDEEFNSIYARETQTCTEEEKIIEDTVEEETISEYTSTDEFEILDEEIWTEMSVPSLVQNFCISEKYIWLTDKSQKLHYCNLTKNAPMWRLVQDAPADKISVNDSSTILWRLYNNNVFVAQHITERYPTGLKWVHILKEVSDICVMEHCAWYVKKDNGIVKLQKNLSAQRPAFRSVTIEHPKMITSISSKDNIVWALDVEGILWATVFTSSDDESAVKWCKVKRINEQLNIRHISLGSFGIGWIIDKKGLIWLAPNVTQENPHGDGNVYQVSLESPIVHDVNKRSLSRWFYSTPFSKSLSNVGTTSVLASSSKTAVFVAEIGSRSIFICKDNVLGHRWKLATPLGMADSIPWRNVHSLGNLVWSQQVCNKLFGISPKTQYAFEVQLAIRNVPFDVSSICAVEWYLWVLSTDGAIYSRSGVSPGCPQGLNWIPIDLMLIGQSKICSVAINSKFAWSVDEKGKLYLRMSIEPPSAGSLSAAWIPIEESLSKHGQSLLTSIFSGFNFKMIWAIDSMNCVYTRKGITESLPIGTDWMYIPGIKAVKLAISDNAVYALTTSNGLFVRHGINENNLHGDYWRQIPGNFNHISASRDNTLWAITKEGHLIKRKTHLLRTAHHLKNTTNKEFIRLNSLNTDDWEVID